MNRKAIVIVLILLGLTATEAQLKPNPDLTAPSTGDEKRVAEIREVATRWWLQSRLPLAEEYIRVEGYFRVIRPIPRFAERDDRVWEVRIVHLEGVPTGVLWINDRTQKVIGLGFPEPEKTEPDSGANGNQLIGSETNKSPYSYNGDNERIAPPLEPLSHEEIAEWMGRIVPGDTIDKSIIRRGLISDQTALRADCARYLASHGDIGDLPYLIDALSDESVHVGGRYGYAGMMTTRYWANVALVCITKQDLGYRWDDPVERRQEAITRWKNHWNSVKHRIEG